jgi:hemolysin D
MFHHLNVLKEAWSAESKRRRTLKVAAHETDFLPAALEVMETRPSPIGRTIIWLIILSSVAALVWACVSQIDEVAVVDGRLAPRGRLRTVEASEVGTILALNVREGQHVNKGDVLIELDPNELDSDMQAAKAALSTAALTRARDNAILSYGIKKGDQFSPPSDANPTATQAERELVQARIAEYDAKEASLRHKHDAAVAEAHAIDAEILKLQLTLPLLKEQWQSEQNLAAEGFGARQKLLQVQQAYITAQQDLSGERAKLDEAKSEISALESDMAQSKGDLLSMAAQERAEAEGNVSEREQALRKASEKEAHLKLVAPVSGTVQQVTVTTIGETPEVGKPLVTLVADGDELVAEGLMLNKDAGFVHEGQPVTLKLEAFPFTRYGTLHGVVEHVSPDSVVDQAKGLVFPIRVRITGNTIRVNGRPATLSAGMSTSLEIAIGKRTIIDYLLSPLSKSLKEAAREK